MTLSTIILLIVAVTATKGDVKEPPYEPSGWKPTGAAFLLPTRPQSTIAKLNDINNEQFPPFAPKPSITQTSSTDRKFTPVFHVFPSTTSNTRPSSTSNILQPQQQTYNPPHPTTQILPSIGTGTRQTSNDDTNPQPRQTTFTQSTSSTNRKFIPVFQVPVSSATRDFTPSSSTRSSSTSDYLLPPPPATFSQIPSTTRKFTPVFQVPASTKTSAGTRPPSPFNNRHISVSENSDSHALTSQDNQPFVHKLFAIVRPLQDSPQPLSLNQNQSPSADEYLPPSETGSDLSAPDDNSDPVANYSPDPSEADLRFQASLMDPTDTGKFPVNNKPFSSVGNAGVNDRPAQQYGVPLSEGSTTQPNGPRIFFVVLPVKQLVAGAGAEPKQTRAFSSPLNDDTNQPEDSYFPVNRASSIRSPRSLTF